MNKKTDGGVILFDGKDLCVKTLDVPESELLVVTFKPRINSFSDSEVKGFGEDFFLKNNIASVHFIPKWNHWWQVGEFWQAIKVLIENPIFKNRRTIWTYGASMGGTGALMAAKPLNATGVIAAYPQASVDKLRAAFDPRWMLDRKKILECKDDWFRPSVETIVYFIYDPWFDLDKRHIDMLSSDVSSINIHVSFSEHAATGMLQESGLLSSFVRSLIFGRFEQKKFQHDLRIGRNKSIAAFTGASALLLKRRKPIWAMQLASIAIEKSRKQMQLGERFNNSLVSRAVVQKMACMIACKQHAVLPEFINTWLPIVGRTIDFTAYQLQAGLYMRDKKIVFDALNLIWSKGFNNPTPGMFGSLISAIRTTLSEDQIVDFNFRWGDAIKKTIYAEKYAKELISIKNANSLTSSQLVIVGGGGYLFLSGGQHSILDYITRHRVPSELSFNNFSENISGRKNYCDKYNILYRHVIFPDKQSVLQEKFPLIYFNCLGDDYLRKNINLTKSIVYPKDDFRRCKDPFLKLDTHLSDRGYIDFVKILLDQIGMFEERDAVNDLYGQITKEVRYSGDLGSKLTPPLFDVRFDMVPGWKFLHFTNGLGLFNDGVVDIYINNNSLSNKRVFIFGDSFFKRTSLILSRIFKEVVFFRTRYFHKDLVKMARPDIVLTSNAERYLSVVENDNLAPVFFLYPLLKGLKIEANKEFAEAMNAILSYGMPEYERFNKKCDNAFNDGTGKG